MIVVVGGDCVVVVIEGDGVAVLVVSHSFG